MGQLRPEDEILKRKIKQRLANLREERGDSKINLSKGADVERQNLNPWTKIDSKRGISIYSLKRLCDALEISLAVFFDDPMFHKDSFNP